MDRQKYWNFAIEDIINVKGHPEILTNGFLADLKCAGLDRSAIDEKEMRSCTYAHFRERVLRKKRNAHDVLVLVDKGKTVNGELYAYRLRNGCKHYVLVQKQYYEYFNRVYPCCIFLMSNSLYSPIFVKKNGEVVGLFMPLNPGTFYEAY
jgi:hypothetical protein